MTPFENEIVNKVREFKRTFKQSPTPDLQLSLIEEEHEEVCHAAADFLKEVADFCYVLYGLYDLVGQEEADRVVTEVLGDNPIAAMLIEAIDFEVLLRAIQIVHESNMSKLDDNGEPIFRKDGKILKSKNYTPPNMNQINEEMNEI